MNYLSPVVPEAGEAERQDAASCRKFWLAVSARIKETEVLTPVSFRSLGRRPWARFGGPFGVLGFWFSTPLAIRRERRGADQCGGATGCQSVHTFPKIFG
jgi:hypothetical protein